MLRGLYILTLIVRYYYRTMILSIVVFRAWCIHIIGSTVLFPVRFCNGRNVAAVLETKDLDENTIMDLDRDGNICSITIEHARERTQIPSFSYEQVLA